MTRALTIAAALLALVFPATARADLAHAVQLAEAAAPAMFPGLPCVGHVKLRAVPQSEVAAASQEPRAIGAANLHDPDCEMMLAADIADIYGDAAACDAYLHELGHLIGVEHTPAPGDLMSASAGDQPACHGTGPATVYAPAVEVAHAYAAQLAAVAAYERAVDTRDDAVVRRWNCRADAKYVRRPARRARARARCARMVVPPKPTRPAGY